MVALLRRMAPVFSTSSTRECEHPNLGSRMLERNHNVERGHPSTLRAKLTAGKDGKQRASANGLECAFQEDFMNR